MVAMDKETPKGELILKSEQRSGFGSGTLMMRTYIDERGDEWTSIGGSAPVKTQTLEQIALRQAAREAGARMRAFYESEEES